MITTIIFDLDGVIIDSERSWDKVFERIFDEDGQQYDSAVLKPEFTGNSIPKTAQLLIEKFKLRGTVQLFEDKLKRYSQEYYETEVDFVPGFTDFFSKIQNSYKLCVATSLLRELFEVVDKRLQLSKLFNHNIFTISEVGYKSKPDPAIFLYAASKLDAHPRECMVIEDAINGIEAAHRAGMYCVGLTSTFSREKLQAAEQVVDSFAEISFPTSHG